MTHSPGKDVAPPAVQPKSSSRMKERLHRTVTIIEEEAKVFCRCSSMKAVPRVMTADTRAMKVFWTLGALGLFSYTCVQLCLLVGSYLKFSVITSSAEQTAHPDGHMPSMPVVTLCVKHPIKASSMMGDNHDNLLGYLNRVEDVLLKARHLSEEHQRRIKDVLMSTEGLFQTIGWQKASRMGFSVDDLIADCRLVQLLGMDTHTIPCGDHVTIQKRLSQRFLNCFDVSVKQSDLILDSGLIIGLQLILYLDNNSTLTNKHPFHLNDYHSSVLAHISSEGYQSPSINHDNVDVAVGNDVAVNIQPHIRKRLSHPYGNCTNYSKTNAFTTQNDCFTQCFEQHAERLCSCRVPETPFNPHHSRRQSRRPFCLNISQPIDDVLEAITCTVPARAKHLRDCISHCPQPCEEVQWVKEVKSSVWPSINYYKFFYDNIIKPKPYAHFFSYMETVTDSVQCLEVKDCVQSIPEHSKQIQNNFAKFSYILSDYRFFVVEDVVKVSFTEMMSQIGGALNLWFGITVVVFLELFELLYKITVRLWSSGKSKKIDNEPKETLDTGC